MKSTIYIDKLLKAKDLKNDLAASKYLGWSTGKISQYRTGKRIMDNEAALQLALELGIEPIEIIMAADIDRAERAGQRSLWEVFTTRTASSVAALSAFVPVNFLLTEKVALPLQINDLAQFVKGMLYIM